MEEILLKAAHELINNSYLAYLFFFISAVLQVIFPPYPGDMVIATSGYLSNTYSFLDFNHLNLLLIATVVYLGTMGSSALVFHLGYWQGDKIFKNVYVQKYFSLDKYERAKKWVDKYGTLSIIFSKFVPGTYTLVLLITGAFKYNRIKSYIAIGMVTILHNSILIYLGRKIGDNTQIIKDVLFKYNTYFIVVFSILIILAILFKTISKKYNK